jgi:hypothetical protein
MSAVPLFNKSRAWTIFSVGSSVAVPGCNQQDHLSYLIYLKERKRFFGKFGELLPGVRPTVLQKVLPPLALPKKTAMIGGRR